MPLNRQMRRELAHNGKLEAYMNDVFQKDYKKHMDYAYRHAWSSAFLALVDRFPEWDGNMLHSIALDTLEYANGIDTPAELAEKIKVRTGFDIELPPKQDTEHKYIPKDGAR